jgi:hypothetical protein
MSAWGKSNNSYLQRVTVKPVIASSLPQMKSQHAAKEKNKTVGPDANMVARVADVVRGGGGGVASLPVRVEAEKRPAMQSDDMAT